ncbi:membrane-associated HD superfamily phosphohydrolase [Weissella uvarum]|uniref:DUF3290 domain-containing protein n=1 Tax=Weissella uvarum TaxID=1479233 RepID=UPI001961B3C5|nr:DUF3290 domain-containing protein [Weissella uvarum]MBM7617191.1 membrane-associated HD superfamily phosphohydrolase [Weissella uvarum]MCM0595485.1 DUF3290 domain-containing protein [Weissella uvarum]
MTFYTIEFLKTQSNMNNIIKWAVLGFFVIVGIFFAVKYFKKRREGRYRDVAVLVLLASVFTIGLLLQDADGLKQSNKSQLTSVMEQVAKKEGVPEKDVAINSTTLNSDMVAKAKDKYYQVLFNSDMNSFTLNPINPVAPKSQIQVKDGQN